jgi:hypothetical protein
MIAGLDRTMTAPDGAGDTVESYPNLVFAIQRIFLDDAQDDQATIRLALSSWPSLRHRPSTKESSYWLKVPLNTAGGIASSSMNSVQQ